MLEYSYEILIREAKEHETLSIFGLMSFECFFLHARNLVSFFRRPIDKDKEKGEASAKTFTGPGVIYKAEQASFKNFLDLINEQITHIQYQRGRNAKCPS